MATITDTTTDANGNIIINVSSSAEDAITLATAGTYSDKNIIFNITISEELTNVVNTALEQAKESGEFDGPQGKTPNIQIGTVETLADGSPATASISGTPENPLLNLGIPQGTPGSGITVSDAMVGQTVKIAAVDENGNPTTWEATDFPESTKDLNALEVLAKCGIITPAYQDGVFYTDTDGTIYIL